MFEMLPVLLIAAFAVVAASYCPPLAVKTNSLSYNELNNTAASFLQRHERQLNENSTVFQVCLGHGAHVISMATAAEVNTHIHVRQCTTKLRNILHMYAQLQLGSTVAGLSVHGIQAVSTLSLDQLWAIQWYAASSGSIGYWQVHAPSSIARMQCSLLFMPCLRLSVPASACGVDMKHFNTLGPTGHSMRGTPWSGQRCQFTPSTWVHGHAHNRSMAHSTLRTSCPTHNCLGPQPTTVVSTSLLSTHTTPAGAVYLL